MHSLVFDLLMFGSNIHSRTSGPPASIYAAEANTLPHEGHRFLEFLVFALNQLYRHLSKDAPCSQLSSQGVLG